MAHECAVIHACDVTLRIYADIVCYALHLKIL